VTSVQKTIRVAVVGVGRIGVFHARHVQELSREGMGCELVAVVDRYGDTAERVAGGLQSEQKTPLAAFRSVDALLAANVADAAVVATRTEDHADDARALIDAGMRVLIEKPLAHPLDRARGLTADLNRDERRRHALMLAFQRRYDEPLRAAKGLLEAGAIGRAFKVVSALEDPRPSPAGYRSPGLLSDMAVHNIDEVVWLFGDAPERASAMGANLHNSFISPVEEDFDDGFLQLWFPGNRLAQITVSRNHVVSYRNETSIYGERGMIHVGRVQMDPSTVELEAFDRDGHIIEQRSFAMRRYNPDVPVFMHRFGSAYKSELADFVARCRSGEPFAVDQNDGLRALIIADAGQESTAADRKATAIRYDV
jgi:myo-inositol 2-dehydrogenase/D-chiro-inositol 1-dehydrogenase